MLCENRPMTPYTFSLACTYSNILRESLYLNKASISSLPLWTLVLIWSAKQLPCSTAEVAAFQWWIFTRGMYFILLLEVPDSFHGSQEEKIYQLQAPIPWAACNPSSACGTCSQMVQPWKIRLKQGRREKCSMRVNLALNWNWNNSKVI